jgi:glyoxylase-like metal-dependent hydrolase (beta-lactamase superfamily II)
MLVDRRFDRRFDRRTFLVGLGHGAFAFAVVSIAGCATSIAGTPAPSGRSSAGSGPSPSGPSQAGPSPTGGQAPTPPGTPAGPGGTTWERVNLGFVSAYLLVRSGEAALVDTGVAGSEGAIEASLAALNLGWANLAHVILTHHHGDHAGSAVAVMAKAPAAAGYAGMEDLAAIAVDRPLTPVGDGDRIFDLRIVTTPGHTAGSISVLDPVTGVLVVGDAMGTAGGRPTLPGAQFTDDMALAKRSIAKLGGLTFETLLVGHGDPIESGADALVAELGAA